MAVRTHCVWEKVVIQEGASPWKLEPEWLSENNDRYDEALLMWALCGTGGAGDGAVGEGKKKPPVETLIKHGVQYNDVQIKT